MDERPRDRWRRGPGWAVPAVLLLIIALLAFGMFRRERALSPSLLLRPY